MVSTTQYIDVSWQDSEDDFFCRYHAEVPSITWNDATKILRFYLLAEAFDDDYWMQLKFTGSGAVLKWDGHEGVEERSMKLFSSPSGILLDHRSRTEAIAILIR